MPKCAGCSTPACHCSLAPGDNVTITGDGSELLPYRISAAAGGGGGTHLTIVAAVDTPPARQAIAQYVCDGVADEVEINAASIAAGYGGTVLLLEGTYKTAATIETEYGGSLLGTGVLSTRIHFDGNGDAGPFAGTGGPGNDDYVIISNSALVADLWINQHNSSGTGWRGGVRLQGDRPIIERVEIQLDSDPGTQPTQNAAIRIGVQRGVVRDCYIEAYDGTGIDLSADQVYGHIERNYIGAGLAINGDGTSDMTIINNRIGGGGSVVATPYDYLHLYGGILEFACGSGIVIWANGGEDSIVSGNIIEGCKKYGIVIDGSQYVTVSNNHVWECSQDAVNTYDGIGIRNGCYGLNIQGNKVYGNHKYGINIADPLTLPLTQNDPCSNTLVANNDLFESANTAAFNDSGIDTVTLGGNRIA